MFNLQLSFAQCTDDTHSTNAKDAWESCQTANNPNPARTNGHWILYDLGYEYQLGVTHFWNYNVAGETEKGLKEVIIDYSTDGNNWTTATQFELAEASGNSNYTGVTGPDLGGVTARYILLFAQSTWDEGSCAGLAEFKVEVMGTVLNVGLLTFVAAPKVTFIELDWRIEEGLEVEIERSTDLQNFSTLALINSPSQSYKDWEVRANQTYYYRLKMMTEDGRISYSPIQEAQLNGQSVVYLFPNPATAILHIDAPDSMIEEMIIHNANGHEMMRFSNSTNIQQLDISSLANGIYSLLLITRNQQIISKRFIKVEG